jgi:hypothetical protein
MSQARKFYTQILLPLCIGTGIYAVSRPEGTLLSVAFRHGHIHLPKWIEYNLPDGLWLFALLNLLQLVWDKPGCFLQLLFWSTVTTALAIVTEFLQGAHIIKGTFDTMDILSYELAFLSSISVFFFRNHTTIIQA